MTIKKSTIVIALFMGFATTSFADDKNDAKENKVTAEAPAQAEAGDPQVKWFHFNGASGEEGDASKYTEETAAVCSSTSLPQRCDIRILSQGTSPDRPDLSKTIQAETKRAD